MLLMDFQFSFHYSLYSLTRTKFINYCHLDRYITDRYNVFKIPLDLDRKSFYSRIELTTLVCVAKKKRTAVVLLTVLKMENRNLTFKNSHL